MEMIIAIIVLAAAATVNFMSFVTLKKQIEANRVENVMKNDELKNLIEIRSNKLEKAIQEGNHFGEKAIGLISCNISEIGDNISTKISEVNEDIKGVLRQESAKNLYMHIRRID